MLFEYNRANMLGTNPEGSTERIFTVVLSCFCLNTYTDEFLFVAQHHNSIKLLLAVKKVNPPNFIPGDRDLRMAAPAVKHV